MLFCRVTLGKSFLQFSTMKMAHAPPGHHSVIGRPSVNGLAYAEYVIYRGEQVCYWSNQHERVTKPSLKRSHHISDSIYSHCRHSMPLNESAWYRPVAGTFRIILIIVLQSWDSESYSVFNSATLLRLQNEARKKIVEMYIQRNAYINKLSRVSNQPSTASTKCHPVRLNAKVSFSSLN